jgi:DNA-binding YbaB/EbfC family protein
VFKGLANLTSLGNLLKQAQQMEARLQKLNEEMKVQRVSGAAGGGLVTVEVNGLGELLSCRIDPSLLAQQDKELIEDLVPAAVNQAIARSKQLHAQAMKGMAEGMNLPGLGEMLNELSETKREP